MTPPGYDEKKQKVYPLLLRVYGGPGSQTVTQQWSLAFEEFISSNLSIVVASIDNTGTGARGLDFMKSETYKRLGIVEAADQINAAAYLAATIKSIDPKRVAIWGWSYGGFMTLFSLLAPGGSDVFHLGISVAPVTDWRYYDSAYTERMMQLPQTNPQGYNETSLLFKVKNLKSRLLLVHGLADDNVHFQNTAEFNEVMVEAGIQYSTMFYTNRDHGITGDGAREHLYKLMRDYLEEDLVEF